MNCYKLSEEKKEEVCVIGGAEIFKATFPYADRLYITKINHEFEGDTFFPDFKEVGLENHFSRKRTKR